MTEKSQSSLARIVVVVFLALGLLVLGTVGVIGWAFVQAQQQAQRHDQISANLRNIRAALARYQAEVGGLNAFDDAVGPVVCEIRPSGMGGCEIEVLFVNRSSEPIAVPTYQLLQEGTGLEPFEVDRDGQVVSYTNKRHTRETDSSEKTEIAPGETITLEYNLCENYELDSNLTGVRVRYEAFWELDRGVEQVISKWIELAP